MTEIFSERGWSRTQVGSCENGRVYKGTGWGRDQVGSSENGCG